MLLDPLSIKGGSETALEFTTAKPSHVSCNIVYDDFALLFWIAFVNLELFDSVCARATRCTRASTEVYVC